MPAARVRKYMKRKPYGLHFEVEAVTECTINIDKETTFKCLVLNILSAHEA